MSKPLAVLISDIHFTPANLELAAVSFLRAQFKAKLLNIPLVVCGDTLDTKAVMRGECVNRLLQLVSVKDAPETIFIVGNHEKINEKSEGHTLHFLKPYAVVIDQPQQQKLGGKEVLMIPYQHDTNRLKQILYPSMDEFYLKPDIVIMHQGLKESQSGEYLQDATAISKSDVAGLIVYSGHYHTRQVITLPDGGSWTFVGNPYTQNYGEATDPRKGYMILNDDGTHKFVSTELRRHIIFNVEILDNGYWQITGKHPVEDGVAKDDLVWVKISGSKENLAALDKKSVAATIPELRGIDFKVTFNPYETESKDTKMTESQPELLDGIIQSLTNVSDAQKQRLKELWRKM